MERKAKFTTTTVHIREGVGTDMAKDSGFIVPQQNKYPIGDDWGLLTNACPIDSPMINTQPGNAGVLQSVQKLMTPVTDDSDSGQCYDSTTKG